MPGFGRGKFGSGFGGAPQPPVGEVLTIDESLTLGEEAPALTVSKSFVRSGFGRGGFGSGKFGSAVQPGVSEVLTIGEALGLQERVAAAESVGLSEDLDVRDDVGLAEELSISEFVSTGALEIANVGGRLIRVTFPVELHYDGLGDTLNTLLGPAVQLTEPGVPVGISGLEPIVEILQGGDDGVVVAEEGRLDAVSRLFRFTGNLDPGSNTGDFLSIKSGQNAGTYQIVEVIEPGPEALVMVNRLMVLADGTDVEWEHTSGVRALDIATSKLTNGGAYAFSARNLYQKWPKFPLALAAEFRAVDVPLPRVVSSSASAEGLVTVTFDEVMLQDPANLGNPDDYTFTGPTLTPPRVKAVHCVDDRSIVLTTAGLVSTNFGPGEYLLRVSTNTPKDVAGNPVDPAFCEAIFQASTPLLNRSVFTDKGPIVKPPITLQSGTFAEFESSHIILLPGAALTANDIGRRLRLTGSDSNDGDYEIAGVLSSTRVRIKVKLELPDDNGGASTWEVIDPRTGQIADDPSDVVVSVEGDPVTPVAVIGLRGQIVLPSDFLSVGQVEVAYSWFSNPRVEVRRLNSLEFRLNAWNRDPGGHTTSNHHYRYNNVLVTPSSYEPDHIEAKQEQPLVRDVKYRAYERAYTAVLNDPTTLLFNTPLHRIAYPPARRALEEEAVFYEATSLPEGAPMPWVRKGAGTAIAAAGSLLVVDNSTGTFPAGSPLFWTRAVDLTFDHVFSVAWRFSVDAVTATEGVWTGLAAGYTNENVAYVIGYLDDGGVRKIGFLRRGTLDAIATADSWVGGVDSSGDPTGEPVAFDWAVLHSYRLFTDRDGVARLYVDGSIVEALRLVPEEAPFLKELNAPFDEIQGVFFGSLSRPATTTSTWDFYRYISQPINAFQTSPSSFVSYEGNVLPEVDASPWTPIGFHGTSEISSGALMLDSTSASDHSTSAAAGLIGGDFHGYVKIEPLLAAASQVVVDVNVQLLTHTHGIDPDGLMVVVDDGTRLLQLCFFPDASAPRLSYGGRSLPGDFSPFVWSSIGGQAVAMRGRILRIVDASSSDGRVYFIEDVAPPGSASRAIDGSVDYFFEARLQVISYVPDSAGFAGAFVQVFDGTRAVGLLLLELAGVRYVAFHSDGVALGISARFAFEWNDGATHTYRIRKSTTGNLVSVFVDGTFLGSFAYGSFVAPAPEVVGMLSFGSSTPASDEARSVVDWSYCNAWRVVASPRRYVGLWKGFDRNVLTGYHLPLKARGVAAVIGNTLEDPLANFTGAGVQPGEPVIVDDGTNKGVYVVASVVSATKLTITAPWPAQPSTVSYRIAQQTDWSTAHKYRLAKDATGSVSVLIDAVATPLMQLDYDSTVLPVSAVGVVRSLSGGLPAIAFGSFNPEHLEQSRWDFVRYGLTRSVTDSNAVPPHQVMNQWNVMESPERLTSIVPLTLTSFKSSSTGTTPQTDPDFLSRGDVAAYTRLNEGTPVVPSTQAFENRGPFVTQTAVASIGDPDEVLNDPGSFSVTDGSTQYTFTVPEDVLYTSLQLVETTSGEEGLLAPFGDAPNPSFGGVNYQGEVCLSYDGEALPQDSASPTPWIISSDDPDEVETIASGGALTYATGAGGTRTAYLNNTPLPNSPSLETEVSFLLTLVNDTTLGTGDSQVRFGLSAPGMTLGIGLVTHPLGDRFVEVFDLKSGDVLGRAAVDYLDGDARKYRIVRKPSSGLVEVYVESVGR